MEDSPEKKKRLQAVLANLKGKSEAARRQKVDDFLHENINQPLADIGLGEVGAGLSAAGSTAYDMLPKDESEFAVGVPVKGSIKALERLRALGPEAKALGQVEGVAAMNAGARTAEDVAAAEAKRKASEAGADTLVYGGKNGPVRRKAAPNPTAEEEKFLRSRAIDEK